MKDLVEKDVRFSITVFGEKGPEPSAFTGRVAEVEGTIILIVNCRQLGKEYTCPDTWHNMASIFFNWIQVI